MKREKSVTKPPNRNQEVASRVKRHFFCIVTAERGAVMDTMTGEIS